MVGASLLKQSFFLNVATVFVRLLDVTISQATKQDIPDWATRPWEAKPPYLTWVLHL